MISHPKAISITTALAIGAVIALTMALLTASGSKAHQAPTGWSYDPSCCSNADCHPIPDSDVQLQGDGSYVILATREQFVAPTVAAVYPLRNFKWSKDQSFHRCNPPTGGGYSYCLYVPMPSM